MEKLPDKILGILLIFSTVLLLPLLARLLRGLDYANMYLMTLVDPIAPSSFIYGHLLFLALPAIPMVIAYFCKGWAPFAWVFVSVVILLVQNAFHLIIETPGLGTQSHGSFMVSMFVGIYGTFFSLIVVGIELLIRFTIWLSSKPKLETPTAEPDAVG